METQSVVQDMDNSGMFHRLKIPLAKIGGVGLQYIAGIASERNNIYLVHLCCLTVFIVCFSLAYLA